MSNYAEKTERYNLHRSIKKIDRSSAFQRQSRSPSNYPIQRHLPNSRVSSRFRSRSRSPIYSSRCFNNKNLRVDEPFRFIAPENNILAIFGLSNRVIEQDLFDIYKQYGCKECKVIIDKNVID